VLTFALDGSLRLPALATAHSHAFQRAMRGRAQRPSPSSVPSSDPPARVPTKRAELRKTLGAAQKAAPDDFWTWRGQMYAAAAALTPESIHRVSLACYRELAAAGVRTVGEFHYVHHQPDGTPYDDRTVLAAAVVRVAQERDAEARDARPSRGSAASAIPRSTT
jgi:cytosine/adenosine deaminase-related metal-dependent hydrolase